jgi:HD superfamily phosphodiesterase
MAAPMESFADLVDTPATRDALARLRAATGVGGPMERHCLRCRHIAVEIATRRGWTIDAELLTVAAILHHIALYPGISRGGVYTDDGAQLAREMLAAHCWAPQRIELCARTIDRHHELRPQFRLRQRGRSAAARRSGRASRRAANRRRRSRLAAQAQRGGSQERLVGELVRELARAFRERPATMPRIFLRPPV